MSSDNSKLAPPPSNEKFFVFSKLYLVLYNSFLAISWSLVLLKASIHISEKKTFSGLYNEIDYWLKIAQTAAVLEVLHAATGLVKSSVANVFPQILSRVGILWLICDDVIMKNESSKDTIGFPMLLFAWTVTEIIRYTYYTNALLDCTAYPLTWCRYTFFLVLYPTGVCGEILCILAAIPIIKEKNLYSFPLPNHLNFGFDFIHVIYVVFMLYPPLFYMLYTYMLYQRKKVLNMDKQKQG